MERTGSAALGVWSDEGYACLKEPFCWPSVGPSSYPSMPQLEWRNVVNQFARSGVVGSNKGKEQLSLGMGEGDWKCKGREKN